MKNAWFGLLLLSFFVIALIVTVIHNPVSVRAPDSQTPGSQLLLPPQDEVPANPPLLLAAGSRAPGAIALAVAPPPSLEIESAVAQLAIDFELPGHDVSDLDRRIDVLAAGVSPREAAKLAQIAQSSAHSHNERFLATSLLAQQPAKFHAELEQIAKADSPLLSQQVAPHSLSEMQRHFEEANRVAALGALDTLNAKGKDEEQFFAELKASSKNPLIRKVAGMGYVGAQNGTALIQRYINAK